MTFSSLKLCQEEIEKIRDYIKVLVEEIGEGENVQRDKKENKEHKVKSIGL